jgi:hypothetical protein
VELAPPGDDRAQLAGLRGPWLNARVLTRCVLAFVTLALGPGCSGHYGGPKGLALTGAALVGVGGTAWSLGERGQRDALVSAGFASLVVGTALLVASGGWMAAASACESDPDCSDLEECREVPPIQGGLPYRQCVPRS